MKKEVIFTVWLPFWKSTNFLNFQVLNKYFRLASDGHELTIFDTGNDTKPASLPFNSTIIHVKLPSPEVMDEATNRALWEYDFHSAFLPFIHHHADNEMGRIMKYNADKVGRLI